MPARQDAVRGATASTILEVADGPALARPAAQRGARRARRPSRRRRRRGARPRRSVRRSWRWASSTAAADVVARALPQLREAERAGRVADAASLRCELASAAVAVRGPGRSPRRSSVPSPTARSCRRRSGSRPSTAWAGARALRGDVEGADAAARAGRGPLVERRRTGRAAPDRPRPGSCQRRGAAVATAAGALAVLRAAPAAGDPCRRRRRPARGAARRRPGRAPSRPAAGPPRRARGRADVLARSPRSPTALPLGRLRCALARRAHLPAGELDAAEALARDAEQDLAPRGHDAQTAEALQVLAAVAEARGDLARTADALRRRTPTSSRARRRRRHPDRAQRVAAALAR